MFTHKIKHRERERDSSGWIDADVWTYLYIHTHTHSERVGQRVPENNIERERYTKLIIGSQLVSRSISGPELRVGARDQIESNHNLGRNETYSGPDIAGVAHSN